MELFLNAPVLGEKSRVAESGAVAAQATAGRPLQPSPAQSTQPGCPSRCISDRQGRVQAGRKDPHHLSGNKDFYRQDRLRHRRRQTVQLLPRAPQPGLLQGGAATPCRGLRRLLPGRGTRPTRGAHRPVSPASRARQRSRPAPWAKTWACSASRAGGRPSRLEPRHQDQRGQPAAPPVPRRPGGRSAMEAQQAPGAPPRGGAERADNTKASKRRTPPRGTPSLRIRKRGIEPQIQEET
jgi:hypothetical protein